MSPRQYFHNDSLWKGYHIDSIVPRHDIHDLLRYLHRFAASETRNKRFAHLIYKPLLHDDSIRLLVLEPGLQLSPIRCRLENKRLGDEPSYEALSYVWGPVSPAYNISINGVTFAVRENLYRALIRLRHRTESRTLWVDAICLNQNDAPERNHQVQQMKQVYESAKTTFIWLGQPQAEDRRALALLLEAEETQRSNVLLWLILRLYPNHHSRSMNKALSFFFSNSWFNRAWIQQEFAVAREVRFLFGRVELASTTIESAAWAGHHISVNFYNLNNKCFLPLRLFHLRTARQSDTHQSSLSEVLQYTFATLEASDPRDYVFALLGLVDDGKSEIFTVNYKASVEEVFTNVASQCIRHQPEHTFQFLSLGGHFPSGEYRESLPSWVPDFSTSHGLLRSFSNTTYFSASKGLVNDLVVEREILTMRGRLIDSLGVYLEYPFGLIQQEIPISEWHQWYLRCRDLGNRAGTFYNVTDIDDVWWRLLVCDSYWDTPTSLAAQEGFGDYYLDQTLMHQEHIMEQQSTRVDGGLLCMQEKYEKSRRGTSEGLNFCSTIKGLLGWVPRTAKEGDKICIFAGATAPFMIRDRKDGSYELIGDAYIHGVMYGEAMDWEGVEWEDIKLT